MSHCGNPRCMWPDVPCADCERDPPASPVRTEQPTPGVGCCQMMLQVPPPLCLRCEWAEPLKDDKGEPVVGEMVECHRFPPTPVTIPVRTLAQAGVAISIDFRWTVVRVDQYCGEFKVAVPQT